MMNEADPVVAAAQAAAAAHTRWTEAEKNIKAAEDALTLANRAADNASHTDDAAVLVQAVDDADAALRRAIVAERVMLAQHRSAIEAHKLAQHDAAEPMHKQGRQKRLAACEMADSARAMMADADTLFLEGSVDLQRARNAGRMAPFDYSRLAPRQTHAVGQTFETPGVEDENSLWAGAE